MMITLDKRKENLTITTNNLNEITSSIISLDPLSVSSYIFKLITLNGSK